MLERSVARGSFVLASGKRSSFYVDARRTTMTAEGLELIGELAMDRVAHRGWTPRAAGGLTLGADPVAYAIALAARRRGLSIDAFTVRKQAKAHGAGRRIEGGFEPGAAVLVVEDVITTGASAQEAIVAVESEGGRVLGVLAVLDRQEGGRDTLERLGFTVEALVTASDLGLTP